MTEAAATLGQLSADLPAVEWMNAAEALAPSASEAVLTSPLSPWLLAQLALPACGFLAADGERDRDIRPVIGKRRRAEESQD